MSPDQRGTGSAALPTAVPQVGRDAVLAVQLLVHEVQESEHRSSPEQLGVVARIASKILPRLLPSYLMRQCRAQLRATVQSVGFLLLVRRGFSFL